MGTDRHLLQQPLTPAHANMSLSLLLVLGILVVGGGIGALILFWKSDRD